MFPRSLNPVLRRRLALGGVSALLLVALTVATPPGALETALGEVAKAPAGDRGGVVRQWSDAIAKAVRHLAHAKAWHAATAQSVAAHRRALLPQAEAAEPELRESPGGALARQGLADLPPPAAC